MAQAPGDPMPIGTRVILLGVYRGAIYGHRPPDVTVKLDRPIGSYKVVTAHPNEVKFDPTTPKNQPPKGRAK